MLNQLMTYTYSYKTTSLSDAEAGGLLAGIFAAFAAMWLIILALYIIAVIGKGHEDYQEIEGVRRHFSDKEEILEAVKLLYGEN